jgi:NAD(P)-dependent dehydrogenase (short-subunit alcohol dehydrogenase family)
LQAAGHAWLTRPAAKGYGSHAQFHGSHDKSAGMSGKDERVALVTGAARRIGRAIAEMLVAEGFLVAIHHRASKSAAEALVASLNGKAGRAVAKAFAADLKSEGEAAGLVPQVRAALGGLDCLINNASIFEPDTFETADRASWQRHMDVNLRAPLVLSQAFARALPAEVEGCIVNIIDQRVRRPTPDFFSYTMSKAGLWTLTQILARALAPRIRVNGIAPGPTLPSNHQSSEEFAAEFKATLLKRPVTPEDIATAVRFVLQTKSVTGELIAVDGGQHLS